MKPRSPRHVALWEAINEFARHPELSVGRQKAVVEIESLLRSDQEDLEEIENILLERAERDGEF